VIGDVEGGLTVSLIRWDPYREMLSLREAMDRLFQESLAPSWARAETTGGLAVPIDMWESEGNLMLSASMPGVKPEDVDIRVTGDTLMIRGEIRQEEERQRGNMRIQERRYGAFQRSVRLPPNVNTDAIDATFENGVLKLKISQTEEAKPKHIQVKAE
jgi:HSP20 family protein